MDSPQIPAVEVGRCSPSAVQHRLPGKDSTQESLFGCPAASQNWGRAKVPERQQGGKGTSLLDGHCRLLLSGHHVTPSFLGRVSYSFTPHPATVAFITITPLASASTPPQERGVVPFPWGKAGTSPPHTLVQHSVCARLFSRLRGHDVLISFCFLQARATYEATALHRNQVSLQIWTDHASDKGRH